MSTGRASCVNVFDNNDTLSHCTTLFLFASFSFLALLFTCLLISFVFVCFTQMTQSGLPELTGVQDLKYVCDALQPQTTDAEATIFFTR